MAVYPNAADHNIPPGPNDPPITPRIIVIHTMVGTIESADAHFRDGSGIEAHFGVAMDGRVWQWRSTGFQADAQSAGNGYCISIETEDGGQPERPWTAIQFQRLVDLMLWIGRVHDIPMTLVRTETERGIGYHRQFADWNPNHHSCPGDVRLNQLVNYLIPTLQHPLSEGLTMDEATVIVRQIATGDETVGANRAVNNLQNLRNKIDATDAKVDAINDKVDQIITLLTPPTS
jgi:hypothetical protein